MLEPIFSYVFHFFFFNDTATTEIYTLSLHDALPIFLQEEHCNIQGRICPPEHLLRSEEHTSELQSPDHLVCRLLLEKKKKHKLIYKIKKKKKKKKKNKIKTQH